MITKIPDNFKKWACSLSGCDGGNLMADTWLCGIEWGGSVLMKEFTISPN